MRKMVWIWLCIFGCLSLHAQSKKWHITPEVGLSVNQENESARGVTLNFKTGVAALYTLKEGVGNRPDFGIRSGLFLHMQRGSYHANSWWGNIPTGDGFRLEYSDLPATRFYLQLPVMAHWSFKLADEIRLNMGVGPYVALGVGGRTNGFLSSIRYVEDPEHPHSYETRWDRPCFNPFKGTDVNDEFSLEAAPRFDWGGSALIGIQVKRISFGIHYDMAWGDIRKHQNDLRIRNHAVSFVVGYTF